MKKITIIPLYSIQIGLVLALVAALLLPVLSYAATYEYVNNTGTISRVEANSSTEALSRATSLAPRSGVMLVQGTGSVTVMPSVQSVQPVQHTSSQSRQYGYVNNFGVVAFVVANTPSEAFAKSVNISANSGVMLINSQADEDLDGDTTTL